MFISHFEIETLTHLPPELVDFARRQFVNAHYYKGHERRSEERHPMVLPVRAVAVDASGNAIGDGFDLITRDVSATSIGLIHTDLIETRYLAIELRLAGTQVEMMIDVMWSGAMGPFYGVAGKYVRRLSRFPVGS
jgi:hypothetical protein